MLLHFDDFCTLRLHPYSSRLILTPFTRRCLPSVPVLLQLLSLMPNVVLALYVLIEMHDECVSLQTAQVFANGFLLPACPLLFAC